MYAYELECKSGWVKKYSCFTHKRLGHPYCLPGSATESSLIEVITSTLQGILSNPGELQVLIDSQKSQNRPNQAEKMVSRTEPLTLGGLSSTTKSAMAKLWRIILVLDQGNPSQVRAVCCEVFDRIVLQFDHHVFKKAIRSTLRGGEMHLKMHDATNPTLPILRLLFSVEAPTECGIPRIQK